MPEAITGMSNFSFTKFPTTVRRAIPLLMSYRYLAVLSLWFLVIPLIISGLPICVKLKANRIQKIKLDKNRFDKKVKVR